MGLRVRMPTFSFLILDVGGVLTVHSPQPVSPPKGVQRSVTNASVPGHQS